MGKKKNKRNSVLASKECAMLIPSSIDLNYLVFPTLEFKHFYFDIFPSKKRVNNRENASFNTKNENIPKIAVSKALPTGFTIFSFSTPFHALYVDGGDA